MVAFIELTTHVEIAPSIISKYRSDYEALTGTTFEHFFCPILHVDDNTELCRGHIIPESFGSSNEWVPQRKDVDNFFGAVAEAKFLFAVEDRRMSPIQAWLDRTARKRHRPVLVHGSEILPHYFPETSQKVVGHTPVQVVDVDGRCAGTVVIKKDHPSLKELDGKKIHVVIERDYRPAVIASLLKAAHLTLFRMLGYSHAFSTTGLWLASILREFYQNCRSERSDDVDQLLEKHFRNLEPMICPMWCENRASLQGTAIDRRVIAAVGASDRVFALGIIIPAGPDQFCVFLPTDDWTTAETFVSFIREPPQSILIRVMEFCPSSNECSAHWEAGIDAIRMPFHQSLPNDS